MIEQSNALAYWTSAVFAAAANVKRFCVGVEIVHAVFFQFQLFILLYVFQYRIKGMSWGSSFCISLLSVVRYDAAILSVKSLLFFYRNAVMLSLYPPRKNVKRFKKIYTVYTKNALPGNWTVPPSVDKKRSDLLQIRTFYTALLRISTGVRPLLSEIRSKL